MVRFWRLLAFAKKYKVLIVLCVFCNILTALFTVISAPAIIPFLQILFGLESVPEPRAADSWQFSDLENRISYQMGQIIQQQGTQTALLYVCAGIIAIFFLKNLFRYLAAFFIAPVRNGIVRDLRQRIFDHLLYQPMKEFSDRRKGDIIARLSTDVQEVEVSIINMIITVFREPLVIIGSLLFLLYVSPSLTIFVLLLMVFSGIIIGRIGKTLKKKSGKVQLLLGQMVANIEENLSGLRITKAFGAESFQSTKFFQFNDNYSQLLTRLLWRRDLSSPLSEFLGVTMVAVLLWFGSGLVFSGEMQAETFLAYLLAFYNVSQPTKSFSSAFYNIQKGMAALERIEEIVESPLEKTTAESVKVADFSKKIAFQNVHFRYEPGLPKVLRTITLEVPKGKVVALVGNSGAGKTTLVDLLLRFYEIEQGQILLDGQSVYDLDLSAYRQLFGVVSQEPVLFNDSIYNNIAFGQANADLVKVETAARIANAHEFIMATENGYQTNIGDQGHKLSGGQRQRLTIARAIFNNPPILILDEATSSLDTQSEQLVQDALSKIMKNRTTIIIAHRLSTVQYADEIVVLKDGCIVEQGTHQHLMEKEGAYRQLVELQWMGK